jgi:hypothetical protein
MFTQTYIIAIERIDMDEKTDQMSMNSHDESFDFDSRRKNKNLNRSAASQTPNS